ncbi:MAG: hypothetical protein ACI87N_003164, partial [Flavobacteriales bacterium]
SIKLSLCSPPRRIGFSISPFKVSRFVLSSIELHLFRKLPRS